MFPLLLLVLAYSKASNLSISEIQTLYFNDDRIFAAGSTRTNFLYSTGTNITANGYTLSSLISNFTDIRCFKNKELCVACGNKIVELYSLTDSKFELLQVYKYTRKGRVYMEEMKISIIENSNYFLVAGYAAGGVMRWNTASNMQAAILRQTKVPKQLFPKDMITIYETQLAAITYLGLNSLIIFDFVRMEEMFILQDTKGLIAYIDYKPEDNWLAVAYSNSLKVISYSNSSIIESFKTFYVITALSSVEKSSFVILAENFFIRFYSVIDSRLGDFTTNYRHNDTIYRLEYFQKNSEIRFYGNFFAYSGKVELHYPFECHNACWNCSAPYSMFQCSNCSSGYQTDGQACRVISNSIPLDYEMAPWGGEIVEGYFSNFPIDMITYIAVGAVFSLFIMIAGFYTLYNFCYKAGPEGMNVAKLRKEFREQIKDTEMTER